MASTRFSTGLRAGGAVLTAFAAGLALSSCMSAGGDGSLFGFTPGASMEAIAADPALASAASAPVEAQAETQANAIAAALPGVGGESAQQPAAEPTTASDVSAASTPTVVAFAAPNAPTRPAGRSLYASLFTESEARTPVRNAETGRSARVVVTRTDGAGQASPDAALPGVDPSSLFEIGQLSSADEADLMEDIGSFQVASLSGMARLAPSGFLVQREDIVTNCFDTGLVRLLQQIERRFGEKVVITSGFRSPAHNRRVNGAKASMHMACKAADLHVPGVSGPVVAAYVRSLPNRGGVGTYCHTAAIHVDVGRRRDWNWGCRRRATPQAAAVAQPADG